MVDRERKKPGPRPGRIPVPRPGPKPGPYLGVETIKTAMMLEPYMIEWGKQQPGGLSALVRRLLREEMERQGKAAKDGA